ncbi:MAG TPA: hypothetical protein VI485_26195 [Vicinamibacterales bacterium]|nr:hypothetical protein [Vicinamibacterales bacterium]
MRTIAFGFALMLLAAPAHAQSAQDPRWNRWLGCWELVLESSREGPPTPTGAAREPRLQPRDAARPRVCVQSTPDGGATFSTTVGTQTPIVQTVVADGTDRPITDDGCRGTQRAEWSRDGLRLFARAELTCTGDTGERRVSGLAIIGPNGTWTDVQSVEIAGRESFRVRRYRRADGGAVTTPRIAATALTLDDIEEASAKVSPRALEAALVETNASFDLTGQRLLELHAAKVPASVVDLIVALSYPDRFVVERRAPTDRALAPIMDDPFMLGWAFGYPIWSDVSGFYSPLYGAFSPYYYSPFAYPYLRGYYPFFGNGYYAIDPGGGGGSNGSDRPSGAGRVVDGQGYTRVRPRESEPTSASNQPVGVASSGSSSGGSPGGTVSSQGFSNGGSSGGSGGGSGGDGGRTAQPR